MSESLTVQVSGGGFQAHIARPELASGDFAPAVVVVQEIFGVNADIRQTCDELAGLGFIAVAPDLFWRLEPGIDLSDQTEAEWKKGFDLYTRFDRELGVEDVLATMSAANALSGSSGKVGVMGYCLGGLLTFMTACKQPVDAAVAYYGGSTEDYLERALTLSSPMLMHLAGNDEYMAAPAQEKIHAALDSKLNVEIHTYPGQSHAFARHSGIHCDAASAQMANRRTAAFFRAHLA